MNRGRSPDVCQPTDLQIETALKQTEGIQSEAADRLGIACSTMCRRVQKSEQLQTIVRNLREKNIDRAERSLMKLVDEGDLGAVIFYLKCQGKSRGWVERSELVISPGKVNISDDV
jgi:hypothetical protein